MTLMYHLLKIQMKGKKTRATAPVIKRVIGARPPLTVEAGGEGAGSCSARRTHTAGCGVTGASITEGQCLQARIHGGRRSDNSPPPPLGASAKPTSPGR